MDSSRFERIRRAIIELEPLSREDRSSRLRAICGDDNDLREEIESLLAVELDEIPSLARTAGVADLMQMPAPEPTPEPADAADSGPPVSLSPSEASPGSPPDEFVGPYRILGVLGRGGMGEVYLAEQTQPIRREVAIKRIAVGEDIGSVLSRFEQERQVLALMEHPGIARVLDAGADQRGRPYFVMEVVRGKRITDFVREERLPLADRIELMERTARAIHHAHQKGVIHRDLKPSNILVAVEDGQLQPKIIDFGIAKSTAAVTSTLTATGQLLGTLAYMSPEQLVGAADAVDVRSDLYALGVILYELVAEAPPYVVKDVQLGEAIRIVTETEIRRADLPQVDEDLFLLIATAMSKDPDLRYGSAEALANDLGRWRNGLPLLARAGSTSYQLRKLVARHRPYVFGAGLGLTLLVAFAVTVAVLLQKQTAERVRAESEARKASEIGRFLREMLGSVDPGDMGREVTVREVLDRAASDVGSRLKGQPGILSAIQGTIGSTYRGLGDLGVAEPHLREALALAREDPEGDPVSLITALSDLGSLLVQSGKYEEARDILEERIALVRLYHGDFDSSTAEALTAFAYLCFEESEYTVSEDYARQALEVVDEVESQSGADADTRKGRLQAQGVHTSAIFMQNRREEARLGYERNLELSRETYGPEHPTTIRALSNLAMATAEVGQREEAEKLCLRALELKRRRLGPEHPSSMSTLQTLATNSISTGSFDPDSLFLEAVRVALVSLGDAHPRTAHAYSRLAWELSRQRRFEEALPYFREYVETLRRARPAGHWETAYANSGLGHCLLKLGRYEEAEELLVMAYESIRRDPSAATKRILSLKRVIELYRELENEGRVQRYVAELDSLESAGWGDWTEPPR